jgi:hypothetical protein
MTVGIPASLVIMLVKPKVQYGPLTDVTLKGNPSYVRGYRQQAHRMKVGKAALGMAIGLVGYGFLLHSTM